VRQIVPTADRTKGIVQVKIRLLDPTTRCCRRWRRAPPSPGRRRGGAPAPRHRPQGRAARPRGRKGVFIREAGKVRFQEVETGAEGEDGTEILKGLQGGEEVVTGGAMVEDGDDVKLKEKK
jgi:hypothetical protein